MKKYIMAFDQGTTSSRCVLYNKKGEIISVAQKEIKQIYPHNDWVEHDPMEIWSVQVGLAQEAMFKINCNYENIDAIGITNQRETTVVWDKITGEPVYNAIVWQCRRTASYCDKLKEDEDLVEKIRKKTGLFVDAYFSASKLKWILDNVEGARKKAEEGRLIFGTIDTWLLWKMTGGRVHITDYSNASRTMMFNINELKWDEELLNLFDIPKKMLPKVMPSSKIYGYTTKDVFGGEIKISGIAGDQQAALFGLACFEAKECKMTYGTGGFLLMNTGKDPIYSNSGLLTTIAWGVDDEIYYALEGSLFIAGAAISWLKDELGLINRVEETEECSRKVNDTNGVYFVPAFVGLGAPYWDQFARGSIHGLTRSTNKNHIVRAVMESLAYQTKDLIDAINMDFKGKLKSIKVDGGVSKNDFLLEFLSDIIYTKVITGISTESTSLGAAYLAGLASGYWKDKNDIIENFSINKTFHPTISTSERELLLTNWKKAIDRSMGWLDNNK